MFNLPYGPIMKFESTSPAELNRREKLYCPDVNVCNQKGTQLLLRQTLLNIYKRDF